MKSLRKVLVLVLALLVFGAVRMPYEASLTQELEVAGLFPVDLEIDTRHKIGQTSSAVALGGLRTLVATFMNLRAFNYFTQRRWDDVGRTYDMIVDLAPRTRYYWETGSWHQAYNAASYYLNDSELPPLRRREAWRSSIMRGRVFLERGIRNNPDDWALRTYLGMMLLDPNKFIAFRDRQEAFATAADAYQRAQESGQAPAYVARFRLYALARINGREDEALALARSLYAEKPRGRTPTLLMLLYVLECHADPDLDIEAKLIELFGTPQKAYEILSRYWLKPRDGYPVHGMARGLKLLEIRLGILKKESILNKNPPPPPDPNDWFRS